jgi:hypothetical protein
VITQVETENTEVLSRGFLAPASLLGSERGGPVVSLHPRELPMFLWPPAAIESTMDSHLMQGRKRKKTRRITALQPKRSAVNMLMMNPKDSSVPGGHLDITPKWDDIQNYSITC